MRVEKIDVSALVNKTKALLENEKISFPIRTTIKLLLKVIKILINQKTLNSRNSSIPPSKSSRQDCGGGTNTYGKSPRICRSHGRGGGENTMEEATRAILPKGI